MDTSTRLVAHVGRLLLASALVCWAAAWWAGTRAEQSFFDGLDNDVLIARDSVLVLAVLGLVLALNGAGLLWWRLREVGAERRRMSLRR